MGWDLGVKWAGCVSGSDCSPGIPPARPAACGASRLPYQCWTAPDCASPSSPLPGGDLTLRVTCDPRQAAAIAAERRARDNQWCPAETLAAEAAAGHSVDSAIQQVLNNNPGGAKPSEARAGGAATQQQHDDLPALGVPQQQQQGAAAAPDQAQPPPGHEQLGTATNGLEAGGAMSQQQQQQQAERSGRQEGPGVGWADFIDLTGDEDGASGPGPAPESAPARAAAAAAAAAAAPPIKRRKSAGSLDHGVWACQVRGTGVHWSCGAAMAGSLRGPGEQSEGWLPPVCRFARCSTVQWRCNATPVAARGPPASQGEQPRKERPAAGTAAGGSAWQGSWCRHEAALPDHLFLNDHYTLLRACQCNRQKRPSGIHVMWLTAPDCP